MGPLPSLPVLTSPNILVLDLECKPGHWIGGDYVSRLVTAAAWKTVGSDRVHEMDHYQYTRAAIVASMAYQIELADIVIGHYERGFDLPLINGMLEREGMAPLSSVLTIDTKLDRVKTLGRSQSLKNLASDYHLEQPKVDVTLREWEDFNDRVEGARAKIIERVVGDVTLTEQLYLELDKRGMLGPPKLVTFAPSGGSKYTS